MGLLTFKGGLHPYDGKELSKEKPIVEYLPQQYVNERHLRALGITKDEFLDDCRAADEFCGDEYVTILSLRKKGFSHSLDRFGFNEWFYASILMEDTRHFSGYRIGGTRIFRHGASGGDFVEC